MSRQVSQALVSKCYKLIKMDFAYLKSLFITKYSVKKVTKVKLYTFTNVGRVFEAELSKPEETL